jgi:hypothetical protein
VPTISPPQRAARCRYGTAVASGRLRKVLYNSSLFLRVAGDCTFEFLTIENMGVALEIFLKRKVLKFWQNCYYSRLNQKFTFMHALAINTTLHAVKTLLRTFI